MRFTITAVVLSGWVFPMFGVGPPQVFSERQARNAVEVAVLIQPSQFTTSYVIALCKSFMDAHQESPLVRYVIFTELQDGRNYLGGLGVTDWEFPAWRHAYLLENQNPPATAEMIRIAKRASVRIRFQDGTIEEHVLLGGSPFDLNLDGIAARLLAVTFHGAGAHRGDIPDNVISVYVQTAETWDKQLAERFSRLLRASFGFPWLELHLEDGWWFAGDPGYPIYNRFLPHLAPPKFDEFRTHARFYCNSPNGDCLRTGPAME